MARGIQEVAEADGYVTGIYSSHGDPERHAAMLHRFLEGRIDGLVVTFPAGELVRTEIVGLARSGVAVVSVFGDAVGDPPIDNLRTDLAAGTRQAMAHLLGLGHKRVAFVGDPNDRARPGRKLSAYRAALEEAGIAPRADYVRESDWGFASGHRAAHQLLALEPRPTAVVAATDLVALGAIRAADERGLRVPEDVSVVGFTDVPVASLVTPPLTTVAEPHAEAGRAAGRLLLARLKRHEVGPGREILLPCQLVVRATSGPPKQAP
jgi:LacI family transcriptional regulator